MDRWKASFLLGRPIFRGYVQFLGCIFVPFVLGIFQRSFLHNQHDPKLDAYLELFRKYYWYYIDTIDIDGSNPANHPTCMETL